MAAIGGKGERKPELAERIFLDAFFQSEKERW
jgi:hypothetical protein